MALRNQPYIPLYVQDFMTDEKLMECSAATTGVYIRLMCIMHKSETYGTILLKQKDKQTDNQILNFANKLAKFLPYNLTIITDGLNELLNEKVISIDGDLLVQKRMLKDGIISDKRSESGSKGGKKTVKKYKEFAKAKSEANSEIEIEGEIEDEYNGSGAILKAPELSDFQKHFEDKNNNLDPKKYTEAWQYYMLDGNGHDAQGNRLNIQNFKLKINNLAELKGWNKGKQEQPIKIKMNDGR